MATALGRLSDEGWSLDAEAAAELLNTECGSAQPPLQQALAALLDADLKQVGAPSLPEDINRADSKKVAGPLVLQVSAVSDISQPSRASGDSERKGRILRLKLTDGRSSCVGIEFAPLPFSLEQLCPGTKVRLRNVTVRLGVLLLEPKAIEVLGGRVEALAEGWEVQQKYGGTTTERAADAADADRPPPFRHFDPKMAKYGSRRGVLAAKSAQTAPAGGAAPAPAAQHQAASFQQAGVQQAAPQQQQRQARRGFQPYQPPPSRQGAGDAAAVAAEQAQSQQQRGGRRSEQPVQQQRQPRGQGHVTAAAQPPPPPQPAAHASAAPAPTAAEKPSAAAAAPSAATQKLLDRLQVEEGRFGRGQRRGRRGRFRDEEEDDGALTLEEWEAQQAARRAGAASDGTGGAAAAVLNGGGSSGAAGTQQQQQQLSDEELARQLQRQLDLEAAAEWGHPLGQQPEQDLAATLFTFDRPDSGDSGGRGRGRGRGRGGRGRGRGSGRGRH